MAAYPKFRDVHLYVGLVVMLPIVLIAGTGVALNHEESLGLKPHYKHEKSGQQASPSAQQQSLAAQPDAWAAHSASLTAALNVARERWSDKPLEKIELKQEPGVGLIVKVKLAKEAAGDLSEHDQEIIWSVADAAVLEHAEEGMGGVNWKKAIHDLHTGKIFSDRAGFFWSDTAGISLMALSLTGIVLYAIPVLKKRSKQRRAAATPPKNQATATSATPELVAPGKR